MTDDVFPREPQIAGKADRQVSQRKVGASAKIWLISV
jgi:hypothetical protein